MSAVDSFRPSSRPDKPPPRTPEPPAAAAAARRRARPRPRRPVADVIDALDPIGGVYHHGGPFDATLAAVNQDKKSSPLEAVRDSNRAALAATPQYFIRDALRKHVPLQGTAAVPPGMRDLEGRLMRYEEGADLMREPDAAGGAYRRWEGRNYHPLDLKGKGEPSYSIEASEKAAAMRDSPRRLRKRSTSLAVGGSGASFEMQTRRGSSRSSLGDASDRLLPPEDPPRPAGRASAHGYSRSVDHAAAAAGGKRDRSGSGSSFTEGLKRRLGSLRRK